MEKINILNQSSAIFLITILSVTFVIIGILYSKNYKGLNKSNKIKVIRTIGA